MKKQLFEALTHFKKELNHVEHISIYDWVIVFSTNNWESSACLFCEGEDSGNLDFKYCLWGDFEENYVAMTTKRTKDNPDNEVEIIFKKDLKVVHGRSWYKLSNGKVLVEHEKNYLLYNADGEEEKAFSQKEYKVYFAKGVFIFFIKKAKENKEESKENRLALFHVNTFSWTINYEDGYYSAELGDYRMRVLHTEKEKNKYFDLDGLEIEKF